MKFVRGLIVVVVFGAVIAGVCGLMPAAAASSDDTPVMLAVSTTSAHWVGAPAIGSTDVGIVHPASNLIRLGNVTATIQGYRYGQYAVATTTGGILEIEFAALTWRYIGAEGSAEGAITAWW